ncbi:single-stranded DNA-binding protein [Bifidobacterium subtile]|jgi:single-strand DNA-binding protein|uniref:Single-stranded DNA-binding protein n=1 Tax=Bifidobacterium subtile TaxID=77635 RepID=A0A087E7H0_9BIFI|nr:single-stranded DNA-binding protein [Bifidobacterium subtile]KFJ03721.1 single-stranded DNA-binding protein [Bifidobacterium subtile]MCI1223246.1 single-stranded DNA-binding protein [Bifidobacterium subtile]MCI1241703.1 single-stranded DNA-binding protein [Bifidobacterium subtile]MCI1258489.1 single-stranded DNA-binding protein [Bifidobacterium subtile]QOL36202.1 single-stranded DNA-binding protein [Bifidobacterium subtile]
MAGETTLTIVGNLTADPEVRTIGSGASVANFTIASTPRTFNRDTNQWEDGQALFMRCAAWRELADHVASSLSKGMRVIAQGRISQRSYQANDGTNRTVVEMTVDEIGPSLRYATAQVTRQSSGSGFSGNRGGFAGNNANNGGGNRNAGGNAGNGGYQGGAGYSGGSGYSGGASAPSQSAPVADPWGSPAQSNGGGFSSFGGSSDFGGDGDEPEF